MNNSDSATRELAAEIDALAHDLADASNELSSGNWEPKAAVVSQLDEVYQVARQLEVPPTRQLEHSYNKARDFIRRYYDEAPITLSKKIIDMVPVGFIDLDHYFNRPDMSAEVICHAAHKVLQDKERLMTYRGSEDQSYTNRIFQLLRSVDEGVNNAGTLFLDYELELAKDIHAGTNKSLLLSFINAVPHDDCSALLKWMKGNQEDIAKTEIGKSLGYKLSMSKAFLLKDKGIDTLANIIAKTGLRSADWDELNKRLSVFGLALTMEDFSGFNRPVGIPLIRYLLMNPDHGLDLEQIKGPFKKHEGAHLFEYPELSKLKAYEDVLYFVMTNMATTRDLIDLFSVIKTSESSTISNNFLEVVLRQQVHKEVNAHDFIALCQHADSLQISFNGMDIGKDIESDILSKIRSCKIALMSQMVRSSALMGFLSQDEVINAVADALLSLDENDGSLMAMDTLSKVAPPWLIHGVPMLKRAQLSNDFGI